MRSILIIISVVFCVFSLGHKDARTTNVHTPFRWVFADSAARVAESVTTSDTDKVAYQKSDSSIWVLRDNSPKTWIGIDNGTVINGDSVHVLQGALIGGVLNSDSIHSTKGITGTNGIFSENMTADSINFSGNPSNKFVTFDTSVICSLMDNGTTFRDSCIGHISVIGRCITIFFFGNLYGAITGGTNPIIRIPSKFRSSYNVAGTNRSCFVPLYNGGVGGQFGRYDPSDGTLWEGTGSTMDEGDGGFTFGVCVTYIK
jgi:hypothetical protein